MCFDDLFTLYTTVLMCICISKHRVILMNYV